MPQEYVKGIFQEYAKGIFQEYAKGRKTTHTSPVTKLTPMPKYTKIQKKKIPTTKTTQNALKYKAKTLYY